MQFVGKLVTSVSDFYRDLNPATLTGAMDVIVVEDHLTKERACTPFHVRIGKLNLMRPQDKRVEVLVNGEVMERVEMKVGATDAGWSSRSMMVEWLMLRPVFERKGRFVFGAGGVPSVPVPECDFLNESR